MSELTPGAKVAMYISLIGVLSDLITGQPVEGSSDEIEAAMEDLGLDSIKLFHEMPLIVCFQFVCKSFAELQITHETKEELHRLNETVSEFAE